MTKAEVLNFLEQQHWQDGDGNDFSGDGAIKCIWGYTKDKCVTIHKVHYTADPCFKVPRDDTEPCLTLIIPRITSMVDMDSINYEEYTWIGSQELSHGSKKLKELMAEVA
jgi:hypothetical protein